MSGIKVGQIDETYSRKHDRYNLASTTTPVGLLAMFKPEKIFITSSGTITAQGLRPLHFEDRRENNPGKSSQAEFNWTTRLLTLTRQKSQLQITLPDGTQDRLSAMYQFMFLDLTRIESLVFSMTNGNKLDTYHYTIGPREQLETPGGQFDTIYLDSQGKPGESRTEIWLETQYNLPCKMIITDSNGDQFTQILQGFKITP